MPSTARGTLYGNSFKYLREGRKYRAWWITGDIYLRERLISRIISSANPQPYAKVVLWGEEQSPLWDVLASYGVEIVILREADKFLNWKPLQEWLESKEPNQPLLVCSAEQTLSQTDCIKSKGRLVHGNPSKEEAAALLTLSPAVFEALWNRVGGDISLVFSEGAKLELIPGITPVHVGKLVPANSVDVLSDCLIRHQKKEALVLAQSGQEHERVIARLGSRLDQMIRLHKVSIPGVWKSNQEIILESGLPSYVVTQFSKYAGNYTPKEYMRRSRLLVVADAALASKARIGVLESLIAMW